MKTIIDAVNELRGDIGKSWGGVLTNDEFLFWICRDKPQPFCNGGMTYVGHGVNISTFAPYEEFNAMVAELSEWQANF